MTLKLTLLSFLAAISLGTSTFAYAAVASEEGASAPSLTDDFENTDALDELDPFDPNIEEKLNLIDQQYEAETGLSSHLPVTPNYFATSCRRESCAVYAHVNKASQLMSLYVHGQLVGQFATSTGTKGRGTPNFDQRPNGRIYDKYTSKAWPGGDYNGLGNMPYAVFISGGFAIHGTGKSNWPKLGRVASHGCIRIHPDNAYKFNRLVRQYGVKNTWITVN